MKLSCGRRLCAFAAHLVWRSLSTHSTFWRQKCQKFPLAPMGVLAPGSANARPSAKIVAAHALRSDQFKLVSSVPRNTVVFRSLCAPCCGKPTIFSLLPRKFSFPLLFLSSCALQSTLFRSKVLGFSDAALLT